MFVLRSPFLVAYSMTTWLPPSGRTIIGPSCRRSQDHGFDWQAPRCDLHQTSNLSNFPIPVRLICRTSSGLAIWRNQEGAAVCMAYNTAIRLTPAWPMGVTLPPMGRCQIR